MRLSNKAKTGIYKKGHRNNPYPYDIEYFIKDYMSMTGVLRAVTRFKICKWKTFIPPGSLTFVAYRRVK